MINIQRAASKFMLKEGQKDEYKRRHDQMWPEMQALIKQAGILNYSIWNIGEELFQYCEIEDFDKCREIIQKSSVKKRWDDYMKDIIEVDPDKGSMELMFYIE